MRNRVPIDNVLIILRARGWTWQDLADRMGVSRSCAMTSVARVPHTERTLRRIAAALEIPVDWLCADLSEKKISDLTGSGN